MSKEIAVDVDHDQTRVAVMEERKLVEIYIEKNYKKRIVGNIYKGKVANVLPGMQAAFVDIGLEKNAFLYINDVLYNKSAKEDDNGEISSEFKQASIEKVLKVGQDVMVQVIKEPMGGKGPRVTTQITLPGRYSVLMPTVEYIGISRRIESEEERRRLKEIAEKIKPSKMGIIIRTVAEGKGEEDISQDVEFLQKLWNRVKQREKTALPPKLIHKDVNLVYRIVRDLFTKDVDRFYINDKNEYEKVLDLLDYVSPHLKPRVELYTHKENIFDYFNIEEEIDKALKRKVWLKSGGYIVIDQTEALTVIDVNTGKYVGKKDLEDTVLRTNLEAAVEIAKQLRLRDIGGIIIIDFIDMNTPEHQQMVVEALEKHLKRDRTKAHVLGLTQLGLVEMTRKKVKQGLDEMLQKICPYCSGKGKIMSEDTMGKKVEKQIKKIFENNKDAEAVLVEADPNVAAVVIGSGGSHLNKLEEELGKHIYIKGSRDVHPEEIVIKAVGDLKEVESRALPVKEGEVLELPIEEQHETNPRDGIARIEGYIVDIEGAGGMVGSKKTVKIYKTFKTYAKGKIIQKGEE